MVAWLSFVSLPQTAHQVYVWNAVLLGLYIGAAYGLELLYSHILSTILRRQLTTGLRPPDYLFNGATFSASIMLFLGIYDDKVLHLIGDTTQYLTLAAFAGLGYSLLGITPKIYHK